MKEMIVIEKELLEKIIKASPIQWFDNKEKIDNVILFGKEYKTEKYPTNWEELKELCRNSKIPKCYFRQDLFIKTEEPLTYYEHICVDGVLFVENGSIYAGYENDNVSNNRTPAQMWQIIKNLIGE